MNFSVGEVAKRTGVSVRSLHHYDAIGLLTPSGRTHAGYRQYDYDDLIRLQQILVYRELGLSLDDIAASLDDGGDPLHHLREQRLRLTDSIERLRRQLAAVDKTLEARTMGIQLDPEEMFEVFGANDPTQHVEEAEQRWGDTDAYRESHRRTSRYTRGDWLRIQAETAAIEGRFVAAQAAGLPATDEQARAAAEAHRQNISRYYYDCGYAIHRGLADMYVADERFAAHYDEQAPGLAAYVHDAIHANADHSERADHSVHADGTG